MEQNDDLDAKNAETSIKVEVENPKYNNFEVIVKIEPENEEENYNEDSMIDCDFQIKEEIDIGPTVLHKPNVQYKQSGTKHLKKAKAKGSLKKDESTDDDCESLLKSANKKGNSRKSKIFTCTTCVVNFSFIGNYNRHIREYHHGYGFKCKSCGKTFKRQYSLKRHQKSGVRCNVKKGEFKCPCGKYCSSKSNMYRHISGYCDKKTYEGGYFCDVCDKEFPNKTRLTVHIGHHRK